MLPHKVEVFIYQFFFPILVITPQVAGLTTAIKQNVAESATENLLTKLEEKEIPEEWSL